MVLITTIIVAGINRTNRLESISDKNDNTGLKLDKNNNVLFPSPPTITNDTLANKNVIVSLSPVFRNPTTNPNTTSKV